MRGGEKEEGGVGQGGKHRTEKRDRIRERERRKNGGVGRARRGEGGRKSRSVGIGRYRRGESGRGVAESTREIQMKSGKKRGRAGSGGER